jgi:carboxyl-terminal processing protease
MFTKKGLFILILLLLGGGIFFAVQSSSTNNDPQTKYEKIFQLVAEMLEDGHFSPQKLNDEFSRKVFKKYMKTLDSEKMYFLASDLEKLKKAEVSIDNELKGEKITSFFTINEIYKKRIAEAAAICKEILSKPFDFNTDEYYAEATEKTGYPKNEVERYELWRKRIKYAVLDRYADLLEQQEKRTDTSTTPRKTPKELEAEARAKTVKAYNKIFERYNNRFKDDDRFHWLVNDISECMDPHTSYYPPVEKRSFDEQMSGEFYGIGASLQEEDGNIKIATIVTGSPAYKSGEIAIGDYILKVAQGDEDPQDLTGYAVEDAVKIIRGKKGTQVKITLKKSDGTIKTVSLIREKINLEDTYAKSLIIDGKGDEKIGYIYLPEFYANFQDPTGARCAADVAKEIIKLKEEQISGIILDLRSNGGGSLMDVVQMVGFFIDEGPVVQVKSRDEAPTILRDREKGILWDGPLVVMVNEFSASASEIFAAAIQDYKRGIVVGSSSTFGKGTVQRNIEIDRSAWLTGVEPELGSLKLTIQKFYRITGASTQLKGVVPDIILPDQYEYLKMREKDEPAALEWDEINAAVFDTWKKACDSRIIIEASKQRVTENPSFSKLKSQIQKLEVFYNEKKYPLDFVKFKANKSALAETVKSVDTLLKLSNPLSLNNLKSDLDKITKDSTKIERNNNFIKVRKNDAHLGETVSIIKNMIRLSDLACPDNISLANLNESPDLDKDGINDNEVKCPNLAGSPEEKGCPSVDYKPNNILFAIGSSDLNEKSIKSLEILTKYLKDHVDVKIYLGGHTDNTGREQKNTNLSLERAQKVSTYLTSQGIDSERIKSEGFASSKPSEENTTSTGRSKNRRVEIFLKRY